ncbi:metalloregulator ArsR/SmtB family transcription factor [Desulfocurvus sp.]|jgi:ArsR family transcriptional regulator|uniref:ArsR/SmtB family transcription factor n=1 Tax=Desulfocurvus sp. TaxID=2871698 RepID=UPI0025B99718|nr:metalloregulator ArsR/SmtB family transcription factor [Desulfocurvus sp.]MCK9240064.1 metalloregulator ArsR/SmtB family transcription factor [Desulfocurvus sp.]
MTTPPLLEQAKALADETRLRLLRVLWEHELAVGEIVHVLGLGQSRISRHLRILSGAGLLVSRRDGQRVHYAVPEAGPGRELLDALAPFLAHPALEADVRAAGRAVARRAERTAAFFAAHAGAWDELRERSLGGLDLAGEILARMPGGVAVAADLGCGTGALLRAMRPGAGRVIGVDSSPEMLARARRVFGAEADGAAPGVSLRIGDLEHLPLGDGEADFAVMSLALHHLPVPRLGLEEAHRVLAPGGRFVLVDFEPHDDESMRERYGDNWLGFDPARVQGWLAAAGLHTDETARYPLPSGLVLRLYGARKPSLEEQR